MLAPFAIVYDRFLTQPDSAPVVSSRLLRQLYGAGWLNMAFLVLAGLLVWRFLKTGGPAMLRMMNRPPNHGHAHQHAH